MSQSNPSYKDTAVQLQPEHFKHEARRARGEAVLILEGVSKGRLFIKNNNNHTSVIQYLTDLWPLDTVHKRTRSNGGVIPHQNS